MTKIKFSIQIENQFGYTWDRIKNIVEKTEDFGYESFYICDHFLLDKNSEERYALEAWSVLTATSQITENIKLGTLVTGNNYRNPALLAKIAASLDHISGGRMEFGIGTGWKEIEYNMYGYDFPPVGDRMDMLEESIQIIKKLFTEKRSTFKGKFYRVEDAVFSPKPESPLFMIGGGGEKRTLKMVAKYADYCNLFSILTKADIDRKLSILKEHCKTVGREYNDVGKSMFIFGSNVFETEEEVDMEIEKIASNRKVSVDDVKKRLFGEDMPGGYMGTPEQVQERIEFLVNEYDFDYFFLQQPFDEQFFNGEMAEKFAYLVKNKYFN